MTIASRNTIKGKFENGDRPQGSDYADWIDSFLHLSDSTAQSISSPLTVTTLGATNVSAATVSADTVATSAMTANVATLASSLTVAGQPIVGSGRRSRVEIYISATAATDVSAAGTYKQIGGTYTLDSAVDFSALSTGEVKYAGTVAKEFMVNATMSMTHGASNQTLSFRISRNGTSIAATQVDQRMGTGSDVQAIAINALVSAEVSARFGVQVANLDASAQPTAEHLTLTLLEA